MSGVSSRFSLSRYFMLAGLLVVAASSHTLTSSVGYTAQSPSYEAHFTFIEYGVHRASSSLTIQKGGVAQLVVDQRHGYKIDLSLNEQSAGLILGIRVALKDVGQWVQVTDTKAKIKVGDLSRYDIDIADANLRDAKGRRIKKLSFGLKVTGGS